jgi:ankyrin repeat protein
MGATVTAQQPYPEDGVLPPDLHRTTHPGYSAIHLAAMMNHAEAIKVLVAAGGDVNAKTEALTTPIHVAAVHGRVNAVSALAELGADINAKNEFGADALRMAKLSAGRHKDTIALLEYLTGVSHEPWTDTAITGC